MVNIQKPKRVGLGEHKGDAGASLGRQAGWAMRGGLPFEAALAAVTITPARLIGVDDRVGSLEVGKDADLVVLAAAMEAPEENEALEAATSVADIPMARPAATPASPISGSKR